MHVKELHRLAKMANTDAKVSIRMTDEDVTVRWYAMPNHPASFSRVLPWTALGEDRGPDYLAIKEYLRMAAFYMERFGGRYDRTSELFTGFTGQPSPLLALVPYKVTREWAERHRAPGGYAEIYAYARNEAIDEMIRNIEAGKNVPPLERSSAPWKERHSALLPNNALRQPRPDTSKKSGGENG